MLLHGWQDAGCIVTDGWQGAGCIVLHGCVAASGFLLHKLVCGGGTVSMGFLPACCGCESSSCWAYKVGDYTTMHKCCFL